MITHASNHLFSSKRVMEIESTTDHKPKQSASNFNYWTEVRFLLIRDKNKLPYISRLTFHTKAIRSILKIN